MHSFGVLETLSFRYSKSDTETSRLRSMRPTTSSFGGANCFSPSVLLNFTASPPVTATPSRFFRKSTWNISRRNSPSVMAFQFRPLPGA